MATNAGSGNWEASLPSDARNLLLSRVVFRRVLTKEKRVVRMEQETLDQLATFAELPTHCHFFSSEHVRVVRRKALQNDVHVVDGRRCPLSECCVRDVAQVGQVTKVVQLYDGIRELRNSRVGRRGRDDPVRLVCSSYLSGN